MILLAEQKTEWSRKLDCFYGVLDLFTKLEKVLFNFKVSLANSSKIL